MPLGHLLAFVLFSLLDCNSHLAQHNGQDPLVPPANASPVRVETEPLHPPLDLSHHQPEHWTHVMEQVSEQRFKSGLAHVKNIICRSQSHCLEQEGWSEYPNYMAAFPHSHPGLSVLLQAWVLSCTTSSAALPAPPTPATFDAELGTGLTISLNTTWPVHWTASVQPSPLLSSSLSFSPSNQVF